MLKKIFGILKKIIMSAFLIYGYNLIASPLNLVVPINLITVFSVSFFGFPALFSFIVILFFIY